MRESPKENIIAESEAGVIEPKAGADYLMYLPRHRSGLADK